MDKTMRNPPDPHETLKEAIGGARLLGLLMIVLGVTLPSLFASRRITDITIAMAVGSSFFLLGPGIIYQLAAIFVKRREESWAKVAQWTSLGQTLVSIPCLLVIIATKARAPEPLGLILM